jgi:SAM-dependent methyltransferase
MVSMSEWSDPAAGMATAAEVAKTLVEQGYDIAAKTHLEWLARIEGDPRMRYLEVLLQMLPGRARVLELGCGAGVPVTERLASRHLVTGVDISAAQINLARTLVPAAQFIHTDMATFEPDGCPFDAVTAVYSVSHLPRDTHEALFARIASWLKPGGLFLASLGAKGSPDTVEEWLGVPMFFSSFDADQNRHLLRQAGFELVLDDVVTMREPQGPASFLWVLARR